MSVSGGLAGEGAVPKSDDLSSLLLYSFGHPSTHKINA